MQPRPVFATIVLAAAAGPGLAPDTHTAGPGPALGERIETYVAPFVEAAHLSGSITVARGDEVVFERSYGLANHELGVPNSPTTRFCVASITKPMTQVIAVRLLAAGRFALEDELSKWIPDFPAGSEITVEMLAYHRAGIPHRVTTDAEEAVPRTAAEMVELAARADPLFEPGSSESYSSAGYSVLARVLELAGGKSYAELLEEHVVTPAGLEGTVHPEGHRLIPGRASSYQLAGDGRLVNSALKNYSFLVGAGSVFSTSGDLVRLLRAVVAGTLGETVSAQLLDEDGGLTWNGRTDGYRAFADYHAERDLYVAFAGNLLTGAGDLLRRDLPRLAAGEEVPLPVVPTSRAVAVDPEILRRYAGDYELRPGSPLTLTVENGEVRMSGWLLVPTSETTFFSPQDYGEITVVKDDDGAVTRLDWKIGDETYPMPRVGD